MKITVVGLGRSFMWDEIVDIFIVSRLEHFLEYSKKSKPPRESFQFILMQSHIWHGYRKSHRVLDT